jgi:hypothetical protein
MSLESRFSKEFTIEDAKRLAVAELGPPKKVKTRRKYRPYMKTYKRKLRALTITKMWGLAHMHILGGKHFVCESCGAKEGYYHAMGRSMIVVEPLTGS